MNSIKDMVGLSINESLEIQAQSKYLAEQKTFFECEFDDWLDKFGFEQNRAELIFKNDFYEVFTKGELDEGFYVFMYHQALKWHKLGLTLNRVMLVLSNCRQVFILVSENIENSLLARGLCHTVDLVQSVVNSVFQMHETLNNLKKKSELEVTRMKRSFHLISATIPVDLLQAFMDHQNWKIRAFSAALGETPEGEFPFCTSECELGQWLDAGGIDKIPLEERESFHHAHEKVHQLGYMALKEAREHHQERIVDFLIEMEHASDEVCRVLLAIIEEEFVRAASLDALTALPNRCAFDRNLRQNMALSKRHEFWLGLIVIDIDYFKNVNDTYGHVYGDQVLKEVAKLLEETIRTEDYAYRWGGEEFAILTVDKYSTGVEALAERVRQKVEESVFCKTFKQSSKLTVSVGSGAFHPQLEITANEIFALVDEQLYLAKEKGRNCVISRTLEVD